jgi:hypothetical protein
MNAAAPLLFSWTPPGRRVRALIFFLIASLLLHAFCFYLFQIVYPPTVALLPPPARVSVISPDNPESLALLRWVEAEDPALAITTQRAPGTKTFAPPKLQHIPSYATHQPVLKTLPEPAPDLSIPSTGPIGAVRIPSLNTNIAPAPIIRKTSIMFAETPGELGAPVLPDFQFNASRPDTPANALFRVAIDGFGAVRFCFLAESSGDPGLDEQAHHFIQLCRFKREPAAPSSNLIWTTATVLWGNDIAPRPGSFPAP